MLRRVPVLIKWDTESNTFWAFDPSTGTKLTKYSGLTYGAGPLAMTGIDDTTEQLRTFADPTVDPIKQVIKNPAPNQKAVMVGFVTLDVPNG